MVKLFPSNKSFGCDQAGQYNINKNIHTSSVAIVSNNRCNRNLHVNKNPMLDQMMIKLKNTHNMGATIHDSNDSIPITTIQTLLVCSMYDKNCALRSDVVCESFVLSLSLIVSMVFAHNCVCFFNFYFVSVSASEFKLQMTTMLIRRRQARQSPPPPHRNRFCTRTHHHHHNNKRKSHANIPLRRRPPKAAASPR